MSAGRASPRPAVVDPSRWPLVGRDDELALASAALAEHHSVVLTGAAASEELASVVELLRAARELDSLGDVLAAWAVDISGDRPDAAVDAVIADVGERLERLGVPREERPRPPRQRGV